MKIFVVTDAKGQVIASSPMMSGRYSPDAPASGRPTALRGQHVHEIDVPPELQGIESAAELHQRLKKLMVPTQKPIPASQVGSPYGWRIDPFTGRSALHTGLDFQAEAGTPILAAAGGVVVASEMHPAYGNMVEVDHGNDLITRYAHASRLLVKKGDLVKRGHKVAEVGTTGRSTGPHLHFEVLVQGVPQDPRRFLNGGPAPQNLAQAAPAGPRRQ